MKHKKLYITGLLIFLITSAFSQEIPAFPRAETAKSKIEKPDDEKIALEYFKNKEYEKALVLYEKLFGEKGTRFFYTYYMYCLIELQDYDKALKVIRKEQRTNPETLRYIVDEGFIYSLEGNQQKATKLFDEALEKLSADRGQINDLAGAYTSRGQTDYAIQTYLRGRKLIVDYQFNLELAGIYQRLENYPDMVNEYLNLLESDLTRNEYIRGRLQSSLADDDEGIVGEAIRTELLRRVQKSPDKVYYSEMLIWYSIQQKDFEMALLQSKSLDRRFGEEGSRILDLANVCLSNQAFDEAIDAYDYVIKKGNDNVFYLDARIGLLNTRYLKVTSRFDYTREDLYALETEYHGALAEFGENSNTVPIMKYLAHLQAFYLDKIDESITLLRKALDMPAVPKQLLAECKIELADVLLFSGEQWDATLLYSQVDYDFKNDPIGFMAKFKNAKLSYYIGEFGWSKTQLDVLKAATSKLIANDAMDLSLLISDNIDLDSSYTALRYFAHADLLIYRNNLDEALGTLDSVQMVALWHPLHDEVLYRKAEIMLEKGKFEVADSLFAKVTEMYPDDILADNALMKRAELFDYYFKNTNQAMLLYQQLMLDYPGSLFVVDARKRFRELRGDELN
ncbi:MAG: tetratricopeptide repeat protein [Bacteroidales bacterium]|nr:tetratricopeptide repeat protein [Bacteroidales bacterium]